MKTSYLMKTFCLTILLTLLMCGGCTQYNGHLGPIFGSWTLTDISEDGTSIKMTEDDVTFSFQNKIVQITRHVDPPYTVEYRYGNFTIEGDIVTMKFQSDDSGHNIMYIAPEWLYFPTDGKPIRFDISRLDGNAMILKMSNQDKEYTYTFKKTW